MIDDITLEEERTLSSAVDPIALTRLLGQQEYAEVASLLESLPLEDRSITWSEISQEHHLGILVEMRADPREALIDEMSLIELDALFKGMDAEDLVELSDSLPNRLIDRALSAMDDIQRHYYEGAQQYEDSLAGHWLGHHFLSLPQNAKVRDALRLLRRELPEYVDTLFLTSRTGGFRGAVKIGSVIGAPDHLLLAEIAEEDFTTINANDDATEASLKVQNSGYSALPVVNDNSTLLGRLDIGTASELVNDYYEGRLMATAGLDEDEDLFSPVKTAAKNRALWLGINLLTAFAAAWFIGLFEATLQQVVALAVLMPVVASMGGIAGSQTLTLVIRGLALGQVNEVNRWALVKKEFQVGAFNGVVWAVVVGYIAGAWFDSFMIGFVISLAILVNIVTAALSGALIPIALKKLKLDPALSGSVVLTTVTDIVGFVAFLGLGALLLT
ncbi:magnesium transporter [Reinekea forsetii]|nr:magnesium transporter [Reinekea forsetii]